MPRERIANVNPDDIGQPTGAYRVELLDRHTGKVLDRVDASNYLTPAHSRMVAWNQARQFHQGLRYVHLGDAGRNWPYNGNTEFAADLSEQDYGSPPAYPVEFIVGTDSTVAENTADDWGRGRVIGYASRWKTGIPSSGPRGQINESQCELGLDSVRLVFDFNEDQGNGTIESLMIGRMSKDKNALVAIVGDVGTSTMLPAGESLPGISYAILGGIDDNGIYFYDPLNKKFITYAFADFTTDAFGTEIAGTPTITAAITGGPGYDSFAGLGPTFFNDSTPSQMARAADGDYLLIYCDGRGGVQVGRWSPDGTVNDWKVTALSSGAAVEVDTTILQGATVIGDNLYLAVYSGTGWTTTSTQNIIQRFDLTTQTVTATIPLGSGITFSANVGNCQLATDGTDLLVSTNIGIVRYSTAGVLLDVLGDPDPGTWTETGIAPWSTSGSQQYLGAGARERDYFYLITGQQLNEVSQLSSTNDRRNNGLGGRGPTNPQPGIAVRDGKLWTLTGNNYATTSASVGMFPIKGGNIFSRSLLDAAIVKTSSSTMKWTYELTLPSEWRASSANVTIPAAP